MAAGVSPRISEVLSAAGSGSAACAHSASAPPEGHSHPGG
jgi:hypothetical protein